MVQRALEEGDAVAQEGTKFISWIRASLPHAVHELSEYPLHCLRLLAAASAAEPAVCLRLWRRCCRLWRRCCRLWL